jgi:hypothetical protein
MLPDVARLLGPVSNRAGLRLPDDPGDMGLLILYSLANHEIVATSKPLNLRPLIH